MLTRQAFLLAYSKYTGINSLIKLVRRVRESLDYVSHLDPETRKIVEESYETAIQVALWFTVAMAACAAISAIFLKEKALPNRR